MHIDPTKQYVVPGHYLERVRHIASMLWAGLLPREHVAALWAGELREMVNTAVPQPDNTIKQKADCFDEWLQKSEWVQEEKDKFSFITLGMHRLDVLRQEIKHLWALHKSQQFIPVSCSYLERDARGAIMRATLYFGEEVVTYVNAQPTPTASADVDCQECGHGTAHDPSCAVAPAIQSLPDVQGGVALPKEDHTHFVSEDSMEALDYFTVDQMHSHAAACVLADRQKRASTFNAADFINKRAKEYFDGNASTEYDTGAVTWHYGEAGRDYYNTLTELAEELRNLPPIKPHAQPVLKHASRYLWLRNVAMSDDQVGTFTPYVVKGQLMTTLEGEALDAAIDAAILAGGAQPDAKGGA